MSGTKRVGLAIALSAVGLMASAGAALGAGPYYASPTGSGTDCTIGSPCQLNQAVQSPGTAATVLLADGTHTLSAQLDVPPGWTIQPQTPGTRPMIANASGHQISLTDATTTIQDVRIDTTDVGSAAWALSLDPGVARRVEVFAQGPSSPFGALAADGAELSDSVVWVQGPDNPQGIAIGGTGATLRNNTIVASGGPNSIGLFTSPGYNDSGGPASAAVVIQNSIIRGDTNSLHATGSAQYQISFYVAYSNYANNFISGSATVYDFGGNQTTSLPLFVNAGAGDFHELAGSPTVDAGVVFGGLSLTDLFGADRCQGTAPDIGAAEFTQGPCPLSSAPVVAASTYAGHTSISGTSAEVAGSLIEVRINGVVAGSTIVAAGGAWTQAVSAPLVAGQSVTARAAAPLKNWSALSAPVAVTVAPPPPVTPAPAPAPAPNAAAPAPFDLAAALKRCKKKRAKPGRKKCVKRAKARARA